MFRSLGLQLSLEPGLCEPALGGKGWWMAWEGRRHTAPTGVGRKTQAHPHLAPLPTPRLSGVPGGNSWADSLSQSWVLGRQPCWAAPTSGPPGKAQSAPSVDYRPHHPYSEVGPRGSAERTAGALGELYFPRQLRPRCGPSRPFPPPTPALGGQQTQGK